jgi:predicted peptidase
MRTLIYTLFLVGFLQTVVSGQDLSLYEKKQFKSEENLLNYRILYPENFNPDQQYPVLLFLHGAGERGSDNEKQLVHGAKLFLQRPVRQAFPAIMIFPQCPENSYWAGVKIDRSQGSVKLDFSEEMPPTTPMLLVEGLLDSLVSQKFTDTSRIYVMGLSMGGMGTFEIVARNPDLFAAAIPICGGGNSELVDRYATSTPFWIFHGALDDVVKPENSSIMALAIQRAGGNPALTIFPYANHNSWDPAFDHPELLPWLFGQKKD